MTPELIMLITIIAVAIVSVPMAFIDSIAGYPAVLKGEEAEVVSEMSEIIKAGRPR